MTSTIVYAFAVLGTNIFAGTSSGGVFRSTNNGTSWTEVNSGLTNTSIQALTVLGTNLFAGTYNGGVFLSTNNGTNWAAVNNGLTNNNVLSFAVSGTNLFAGTRLSVCVSTNNGTSWTDVSSGLTNPYIISLVVSGTNIFAGTWGSGVWRRPLSEMTSINITSGELPGEFRLQQNYPNPFNPTTRIKFDIPKNTFVKLEIYNNLGQLVKTLFDGQTNAGYFETTFDGNGLSSGTYFYKLTSPDFSETKMMILLK